MFIIIIGFVAVSMVQAFSGTMRGSHYGKQLTQGAQVAQQRLEVILGRRKTLGYTGFTVANYDPCPPVGAWAGQLCQSGSYTVTTAASFAANVCGAGTGTDCRQITVTVTGPNGDVVTRLTQQVWNY
jgi:hypothetical protein